MHSPSFIAYQREMKMRKQRSNAESLLELSNLPMRISHLWRLMDRIFLLQNNIGVIFLGDDLFSRQPF
jgi:hypothetical protein